MKPPRALIALTALIAFLAAAALFAVATSCSRMRRAGAMHSRGLCVATAVVVAVAAVWMLVAPLAATAVPLLFAVAGAARSRRKPASLASYVAASDRAGAGEPSWWPEFERQFRRECRRHRHRRLRASHVARRPRRRTSRDARWPA